jgi:hypothetical protein
MIIIWKETPSLELRFNLLAIRVFNYSFPSANSSTRLIFFSFTNYENLEPKRTSWKDYNEILLELKIKPIRNFDAQSHVGKKICVSHLSIKLGNDMPEFACNIWILCNLSSIQINKIRFDKPISYVIAVGILIQIHVLFLYRWVSNLFLMCHNMILYKNIIIQLNCSSSKHVKESYIVLQWFWGFALSKRIEVSQTYSIQWFFGVLLWEIQSFVVGV